MDEINQFYANFHSTRWLKRQFVIRMNHPLSDRALAHLQEAFASLRLSGDFQQIAYTGEEHDELRIPRHPATQPANIRPPIPRSSGQAVGAQRRRFALLV